MRMRRHFCQCQLDLSRPAKGWGIKDSRALKYYEELYRHSMDLPWSSNITETQWSAYHKSSWAFGVPLKSLQLKQLVTEHACFRDRDRAISFQGRFTHTGSSTADICSRVFVLIFGVQVPAPCLATLYASTLQLHWQKKSPVVVY
jgi:hypothetical protein